MNSKWTVRGSYLEQGCWFYQVCLQQGFVLILIKPRFSGFVAYRNFLKERNKIWLTVTFAIPYLLLENQWKLCFKLFWHPNIDPLMRHINNINFYFILNDYFYLNCSFPKSLLNCESLCCCSGKILPWYSKSES